MKKVLVISYYWPPSGGPGVQRIVRFTKHMPQFGWHPIILTVKHPTSPFHDESLLEDIPQNTDVHKTSSIEPFYLYNIMKGKKGWDNIPKDAILKKQKDGIQDKISRLIRANLFIPDARVGWVPWIMKEGSRIIKSEKINVLFSTSPPHSLQIGARRLAVKHSLKWIADFRDPWVGAYWEKDLTRINFLKKLNKNIEQNILDHAHKLTTPSEGYVPAETEAIRKKIVQIYTGFDEINRQKIKTEKFNITFLGNLSSIQSPECLLLALMKLPAKLRSEIKITFVGNIFEDHQLLFSAYPKINISIVNYLPFNEAIDICRAASLLLFIVHETSYATDYMPIKLFDYLSLRKPILVIGRKNSKIEQVVKQTQSGKLFERQNLAGIRKFLLDIYNQWKDDKFILLQDNSELRYYQTKNNVKKLVSLFEE